MVHAPTNPSAFLWPLRQNLGNHCQLATVNNRSVSSRSYSPCDRTVSSLPSSPSNSQATPRSCIALATEQKRRLSTVHDTSNSTTSFVALATESPADVSYLRSTTTNSDRALCSPCHRTSPMPVQCPQQKHSRNDSCGFCDRMPQTLLGKLPSITSKKHHVHCSYCTKRHHQPPAGYLATPTSHRTFPMALATEDHRQLRVGCHFLGPRPFAVASNPVTQKC